jgi:uncharacterized protein (DUF1015 family)
MPRIHPFRALRPVPLAAARVASPPYDVVTTAEARELCEGNPDCFLRVVRPEVALPDGADAHSLVAYERGREALGELIERGAMARDTTPSVYVYRLISGSHVQTGLVCGSSVSDYRVGVVRKHEHTRPDKEQDRADHIESLGAQCGPVFLICRGSTALSEWFDMVCASDPVQDFLAEDGISHTVWVVSDTRRVAMVVREFSAMEATWIADGHHRSAAAAVVRDRHLARDPKHAEDASCAQFLTVIFPEDQVQVLPYNRLVADLGERTPGDFLAGLTEHFVVQPLEGAAGPVEPRTFDCFVAGAWHRLTARPESIPEGPVAGLDVALLQDRVLGPLLGVLDPRTDQRIRFAGGSRGTAYLEREVSAGRAAVAFALHPTPVSALLEVAEAGLVMPPKSTWFEPKLRSGLFVHLLDD